jgi:hypothetical protein
LVAEGLIASLLSVFNAKEGCIQPGCVKSYRVTRAYRDNKLSKDLRVTSNSVRLGELAKYFSLGKVLLQHKETDSW